MKFIRFKAAAVFMHQGRVLVHQVENESSGETWYIPPGGGIEYGESSLEALKREIREEFGWSTRDERLIGASESFHTINGKQEHEIVFIYFATPVDDAVLEENEFLVLEEDGRKQLYTWKNFETLKKTGSLLYPKGLLEKIDLE